MGAQLSLFAAGPDSDDDPSEDFWSCSHPDLVGGLQFVACVWAPGDPDRSPRDGSDMGALWRKALKAQTVEEHEAVILAHLADGKPRSFNRICVELYDKTAVAMLDLPPDEALWSLTDKGLVEHTNVAPILWRLKEKAA
jgi:hypothetical protein